MHVETITTDVVHDWSARRQTAQTLLDELRQERGIALLEGKSFDHKRILDAEAQLDALQIAEVEAERRRRENTERERLAQIKAKKAELRHLQNLRLSAIDDAENAAVGLMLALKQLSATTLKASAAINALGFPVPVSLSPSEVDLRTSIRVASILSEATSNGHLGLIKLPGGVFRSPMLPDGTKKSSVWRDVEIAKTEAALSAILEEGE
ncbi:MULTISPECIES: hypothetical protein [unclassified Rhizobium]|uniref:hypothetical protein n=1 Tax=unclassified Rhizobium TaxID=2613769 RepID=UPI00160D62E5|nr:MULTISPECIES: hypothetical protein [unclassified Rhizobium]MBB3288755.1 hypothetical protein [Rhizobium sp. BK252]MBB3403497.1 hypothetical protein [Rhizobium sp. BK289]MBB3416318.1 hypothetical protein [Rhizobium sp. BK284]MBB3483960.1 hypothetical protein [Rhizobium sp. BK347]